MFYNKEYLSSLAEKIRMPEDGFNEAIKHFDDIPQEEAERIAYYFADLSIHMNEKYPTIQKIAEMENGELLCVLIYMASAGYTYENYKKLGIGDDIFYDSFNCLAEKMVTAKRFTGSWGYSSVYWPIRITNLQTFRIGRLSYAIESAPDDIMADGKLLLKKGQKHIHIHIPDNDKLCGCEESILNARAFFEKFYPQHKDSIIYTRAWLLDPRLAEILPKDSNILAFQKLFNIIGYIDGEEAVLSRVFGEIKENLEDYNPQSSLARGIIDYLKSGKRLGSGMGYTSL